jgi:hypothetical protein
MTLFFSKKKKKKIKKKGLEKLAKERGLKKEDKHSHMQPPIPLSCFHEIEISSSITSGKTNWSSAESFAHQ